MNVGDPGPSLASMRTPIAMVDSRVPFRHAVPSNCPIHGASHAACVALPFIDFASSLNSIPCGGTKPEQVVAAATGIQLSSFTYERSFRCRWQHLFRSG